MFFDFWSQLKMSAFNSISSQINLVIPITSHKLRKLFYSQVAMPIMIVAFLPYIVCWDATIAPYL